MPKQRITINTIFDGQMPSGQYGQDDQYLGGIGIDPDLPLSDASDDTKTAGAVRPVSYETFSGGLVDSYPINIITTPKNSNTYVVLSNGKLLSYSSTLGSETLIGQVSASSAKGAWYYNNYIYITTPTNVSRYGPLDGTPALVDDVWTGATLGSQTILTSNVYPTSLLGVPYLSHHGIVHLDGACYFLDYKDGVGMVHFIKTKKVTFEGDTNDTTTPSAYNVLDLPQNFLPITLCSYGNDIVVAASYTTSSSVVQGKACLFFFSPGDVTPTFYRQVFLPDTICSGLEYANGSLFGMSGDIAGGYRLFQYVGGDTIQTVKYLDEGHPPLQNAVESVANKIVWAADTTEPMIASGLYAFGSKSDLFTRGLHHIATSPLT